MGVHTVPPAPRAVIGCNWTPFDATTAPMYPFGNPANEYWMDLGVRYTALIFVVHSTSGKATVTPEASMDKQALITGPEAPESFDVNTDECRAIKLATDVGYTHFRLLIDGGVGHVAIYGTPR